MAWGSIGEWASVNELTASHSEWSKNHTRSEDCNSEAQSRPDTDWQAGRLDVRFRLLPGLDSNLQNPLIGLKTESSTFENKHILLYLSLSQNVKLNAMVSLIHRLHSLKAPLKIKLFFNSVKVMCITFLIVF